MTVQDELVRASAGAAPIEKMPEATDSLQSCSCDELRAIAARGIHGGDLYFAAAAELERRAHDSETALEAREEESSAQRQRQIWWVAVLIAALAAGAIARGVIGL